MAIVAKLADQLRRVGVHLQLAAGEIIVEIGHFGGLGQHQPHVADLAARGVGFGGGDASAKTAFAGPGELLRGLDHPPALRPDAARGNHVSEHRIVQRDHLGIALGGRPPCLADGLKRRVASLNLGDQSVQGQLGPLPQTDHSHRPPVDTVASVAVLTEGLGRRERNRTSRNYRKLAGTSGHGTDILDRGVYHGRRGGPWRHGRRRGRAKRATGDAQPISHSAQSTATVKQR